MKLTNELLQKIATDFVKEKSASDYGIKSIALMGSVLKGDAIVGNTADVDLLILESYGGQRREMIELTEDVHLDLTYYSIDDFQQTVELRAMPYKGYMIYGCKPLFDPEHLLDFVQAGVRGNFFAAENVMARVNALLGGARERWLKYQMTKHVPADLFAKFYFELIHDVLQSIVLYEEAPLGVRKLLVEFPRYAKKVGDVSLFGDVLGLLGVAGKDVTVLQNWVADWQTDYDAVQGLPKVDAQIDAVKKNYYLAAIEEQLASDVPFSAAWTLLSTWVDVATFGEQRGMNDFRWQAAAEELGFMEAQFGEKMKAMDGFLDKVEAIFADWKSQNGFV